MDARLVEKKAEDYGLRNYQKLLEKAIAAIPVIASGHDFQDQMKRFVPKTLYDRTFESFGHGKYFETAVNGVLKQLQKEFGSHAKEPSPPKRTRRKPDLSL